ncbi:MAG TPA: membrane protein insertase YidC [Roseiarcus sp.]|nr:membrane protein insertase YidC [Roseiarcus sp.]
MNSEDSRNLILAIALSILVLIGWNYFYGAPLLQKERHPQSTAQTTAPPKPGAAPSTPGAAAPLGGQAAAAAKPETRPQALAATKRVIIDTPSLGGSINLTGGLIDDLILKHYRETTDPHSPNIALFSPQGAPEPYWAETGFVPNEGSGVKFPTRDTVWQADSDKLTPEKPVTLTYDNGAGLIFRHVIAVDDKYMFTIKDSVENKGGEAVTLHPYALILRRGTPQVSGYSVLHEGFVGVIGNSSVQEITYSGIEKETHRERELKGDGGWLGFTDKYWASAIIPDQSAPVDAHFAASGTTAPIDYQTDYLMNGRSVAPGATSEVTSHVFAGAKEVATIDNYEAQLGIKKFDLMIDWGWFYFITKPLFRVIDFIYKLVGNFGVAIIIVTILIKGAFFPLANRSYASMAKMKAIQPEIAALKERFPDDRAKQQQAQMELFKREGVNPVAGCLPMVIQIPVFFALYKVIFITIEMRQAPFFGWIKDLSAPDPTNIFTLFGLIPWDPTVIPGFGHFLHLGIWPLIMGVSMFVQMKMNPEPADPVQKTMFSWMPVIFTFMLGSFPSGLVIYWTCNNTLSVIQQYVIMRRAGVKVELWDNLAKLFRRLPGGAATQAASPARSDRPRPSPPARAKKARDGAEAGNKARESDA